MQQKLHGGYFYCLLAFFGVLFIMLSCSIFVSNSNIDPGSVTIQSITPVYDEETYDYMINKCGNKCAFLMNVPDELVDLYDEGLHYHHRATETTKAAHKYILEEPLIKAVFAGHIHHVFESQPNDKTMQFVVGGGAARIIEIT